MLQTPSPLTSSFSKQLSDKILCSYNNYTNHLQVVKINNIERYKFERVVFPGERFLFEAVPGAELKIYKGKMGRAYLADIVKCAHLLVE